MKMVAKTAKSRFCRYCGKSFPANGRGRPSLYCGRSHRERAYEKRRLDEIRHPPVKARRLLMDRLDRLEAQRRRLAHIYPLLQEFQHLWPTSFRRAVSNVYDSVKVLAPEVLQLLGPSARDETASAEDETRSARDESASSSRPSEVFRRLAQKYHPDREGGDTTVMQDLAELHQAWLAEFKRRTA